MPKSVYSTAHEHLVKTLREAREAAGLKQEELAERIGRDRWVISSIETGQRRVEVLEFHAIALALGIDPAALFVKAMAEAGDNIVAPDAGLPTTAPELYDERADRSENPVAFMNRVWGPWLPGLYQDTLRKLDPKLIPAIKSFCQKRKIDAKSVLPRAKIVRFRD